MEKADKLQGAVDQLSSDEQKMVDKIFDAILQIHHYKDQDQLIKFIVQHLNSEVTENQVRGLFMQLMHRLGNAGSLD